MQATDQYTSAHKVRSGTGQDPHDKIDTNQIQFIQHSLPFKQEPLLLVTLGTAEEIHSSVGT